MTTCPAVSSKFAFSASDSIAASLFMLRHILFLTLLYDVDGPLNTIY